VAIAGSELYGTIVHPAAFEPSCDAYKSSHPLSITFQARSVLVNTTFAAAYLDLNFAPSSPEAAYPLSFYKALLGMPIFMSPDGKCDSMTRFWNTPLTKSPNFAPRNVVGSVKSNLGPLASGTANDTDVEFADVQAVLVATPFLENNYVKCEDATAYLVKEDAE